MDTSDSQRDSDASMEKERNSSSESIGPLSHNNPKFRKVKDVRYKESKPSTQSGSLLIRIPPRRSKSRVIEESELSDLDNESLSSISDTRNDDSEKIARLELTLKAERNERQMLEKENDALEKKFQKLLKKFQASMKKKAESSDRNTTSIYQRHRSPHLKAQHGTTSDANYMENLFPSNNPFLNTVDQLSATQIIDGGPASVAGLNRELRSLVNDIIEQAQLRDSTGSEERGDSSSNLDMDIHPLGDLENVSNPDEALLEQLSSPEITHDDRGLLLDAAIHHIIVSIVYLLFFDGNVVPAYYPGGNEIEEVYDLIYKQQAWSISQRWRAITADNVLSSITPDQGQTFLNPYLFHILGKISAILSLGFQKPEHWFDSLLLTLRNSFWDLLHIAHALSLSIRRDILSVRMTVTTGPLRELPVEFNPREFSCIVLDTSPVTNNTDDIILTVYDFGLSKRTADQKDTCIVKPSVMTSAILRAIALV